MTTRLQVTDTTAQHTPIKSITNKHDPQKKHRLGTASKNPLRCYHCQVFGHQENKCGRHAVCCNFSKPENCGPSGVCDEPAKCVNCSGDHPANSKQCPQWEKEKKILKINCESNLSFPEARKQYEQCYTGQTYASAVKPGTCNKSTQTVNTSTQTDGSFTEYLNNRQQRKRMVHKKNVTQLHIQEKVTPLILGQPLRRRP